MTRRRLWQLLAAGLAVAVVMHGCALQPRHDGAPSAHFDGVRFHNRLPADKSLGDIVGFLATFPFRREAWPQAVANGDYPPRPAPGADGIVVTFVNHSTVLLSLGEVNVLTDPIWSERASPFSFLGPTRVRAPGLALAELPPIDLVLVSHDHYDHLDLDSLQALAAHGRDGPPLVLAGLGNESLFEARGITPYRVLDWWQTAALGPLEASFVEVRHRSGRGLGDQMKTLWGGFVLRAPQGRVYFAGDTGYGPHFAAARTRFGGFDLCLLPIAAYRPRDFMLPVHLDPQGAVQAHLDLGCRQSIAIHHGTFQLTFETIDEPYAELARALDAAGVPADAFRVLGFGESLRIVADGGAGARSAEAAEEGAVAAAQIVEFVE
ncbi:MAG: MBL fold metallo-hydrolase [Gammaproteobacteria bacterium]|nr:MBL fold metallo-hydrolase [Gammaproteobacteria bacterium]MCP5198825.1 MBL fold metallo-hydrolase [Gammaproteobacteria bacterium]